MASSGLGGAGSARWRESGAGTLKRRRRVAARSVMDAAEVEFLAEKELVTIIPNFSLDKIYLIGVRRRRAFASGTGDCGRRLALLCSRVSGGKPGGGLGVSSPAPALRGRSWGEVRSREPLEVARASQMFLGCPPRAQVGRQVRPAPPREGGRRLPPALRDPRA